MIFLKFKLVFRLKDLINYNSYLSSDDQQQDYIE